MGSIFRSGTDIATYLVLVLVVLVRATSSN